MSEHFGSEEEGHPAEGMEAAEGRAQRNPLLIFGVAIFAAAAFYLALIVATQADDILLPGNGWEGCGEVFPWLPLPGALALPPSPVPA